MIRSTWRRILWWSDQHLQRLGRRETWLLALALLIIIGGTQYLTAYTQGWYKQDDTHSTLARQADERAELTRRLDDLRDQQNDPKEASLQQQAGQLRTEITQVNDTIARMTDAMVPPAQMIRVVRQLLDTRDDLTLQRFETLPVTQARLPATGGSPNAVLYRHGIALQLSGTFNAVADYIRVIELMARQIYWENLEFRIQDYPSGEASITVYTLSNNAGWLDV